MASSSKNTKYKKSIICWSLLLIALTCILIIALAAIPPKQTGVGPSGLIAHGGGEINGKKCTNSVEAVENAVSCGIRLIELDVAHTANDKFAALHDWTKFRSYCSLTGEGPLSLEKMTSCKMFEKLTPITIEYVDSLMNAYNDLYLVLDKETEFSFIHKNLGKFKQRIIVECFDVLDYVKYRTSGYLLPMMSGKPTIRYCVTIFLKTLMAGHPMFCGCYAVDIRDLNSGRTANPFKRIYSPDLAVFTLPDEQAADSLMRLDDRVKFVYIDNVEVK